VNHKSENLQLLRADSDRVPNMIKKTEPIDISKAIRVDKSFIDFGSFYPGSLIKFNFQIKNLTNEKKAVLILFDNVSPEFTKDQLAFNLVNVPYCLNYPIKNSEHVDHCWYFMLPTSKALEKLLVFILHPRGTVPIGIIIDAPRINYPKKLFSLLKINLFDIETRKVIKGEGMHSLGILSEANIETPKLKCCRELLHIDSNFKVIPIVVKNKENPKNIYIPFKNEGNREIELILDIVNFPVQDNQPILESLAEYRCQKTPLRFQANFSSYITININRRENIGKRKKERKVLIAKIKDTSMIYSYILDFFFLS